MNDKYIRISENVRIINPYNNNDVSQYFGDVNDYDFEKQKNNYEQLSKIFNNHQIIFSTIWAGKFKNCDNRVCSRFVVMSTCGRVFWRKYCGMSEGSGQNFIYINGNKYKTTKILKMSQDELISIL